MPQSLRDFFLPIHWKGKFLKHTGPCLNRGLLVPPGNIKQSEKPCHFRKFKIEGHVVSNSSRVTWKLKCRTPQTWHCNLQSFSLPKKVNTNSKQKNILAKLVPETWDIYIFTLTRSHCTSATCCFSCSPRWWSMGWISCHRNGAKIPRILCFPSRDPFESTKL